MGDKTKFKTPVPSANEETRTKKVITAVDSEGNLIHKPTKGGWSTTGAP